MTAPEQHPHRWLALVAAVTALFMTLLDLSIVIVALPTIGTSLGAGPSQLQWVVSGYALAFGVVPIIAGRLGDDLGRRRMLLGGIVAFVVTSLLAGLAPNPGVLIAARLLQGLAGGLLNPQVSGLVQQMFRGPERGRAFGLIGTAVGVATAAGPVLGGVLVGLGGTDLGWRLCFLVNLPVGVVAFVLCWRLLPGQVRDTSRTRGLDLPGAALLTLTMLGVLYPFVQYDASRDARLALVLLPAAVCGYAFWRWEQGPAARGGHPLIDVGLFRIRSYADGVGFALLYFIGYTGTPLVLALFLQEGLGYSALQSGLAATAFAVGTAVSAPIGGRLVPRLGRRLLVGAMVLFLLGVAGTTLAALLLPGHVPDDQVALYMAGPLLVAGLGGGSVITPNQALSLAEVDARGGSTAGGMLQTSQRVGAAIGTAVLGAVFYAAAASAPAHGPGRSDAYGNAYATSLLVTLAFGLAALAVAVREARAAARRAAPPPAVSRARH